ncbi:hypothetical protein BDL97_06G114000 [Sphagnum fallax]|nr:hypothetical protein BDL97_06G114000 [Sphagnum fallax]
MIPLRTKCSATRPRPAPRANSINLHESTTDPAEVAAMRGNIPASCPVSTRDPLPGLSTDIPIIVLFISDDEEGMNKVEEASTRINRLQHDEISRLQHSAPLGEACKYKSSCCSSSSSKFNRLPIIEATRSAKDDAAAILAPPNITAAAAKPPSSNSASLDDEDDVEEEHDDGPAAGAATLHCTYSRPKNACRKSFGNYNNSSSYYMSSMSHDPASGSSTRASRLPPYPYVREPSIPPLQHQLLGAGRRSKKQADK